MAVEQFKFSFETDRYPNTILNRLYIAWRVFLLLSVFHRQLNTAQTGKAGEKP